MKRRVRMCLAVGLALAVVRDVHAWPPKVPLPVETPPESPAQPPPAEVPAMWFPVGEQLRYGLYWGLLPVGTAVAWSEWVNEGGRWQIALRLRTRSSAVLDAIYPVDDFLESRVDPLSFLPIRFVKKINEGANRYDEVTEFDYAAGVAKWRSLLRGREKELPIDPTIRDIPSLLYWFRRERIGLGDDRAWRVMADNKIYTVLPRPVAEEVIAVSGFGRVRCIRYEPAAEFNGLFVRKGKVWLWVSDDERRVAMRIDAEVPVARVRAVLNEIRQPVRSPRVARQ
ncbi:MAG: DUF3108 domain-containing protein [Kiritimatiellae bacterium]|nr:DUF3108 domain-containing protein [Kiritimatiellia bacterium]